MEETADSTFPQARGETPHRLVVSTELLEEEEGSLIEEEEVGSLIEEEEEGSLIEAEEEDSVVAEAVSPTEEEEDSAEIEAVEDSEVEEAEEVCLKDRESLSRLSRARRPPSDAR
jgi:hypothetical protein